MRIWLWPLLLGAVLGLGLLAGQYLSRNHTASAQQVGIQGAYDKIQDVLNYISNAYVDTVNPARLSEDAIVALLTELDPHSVFIPAEDYHTMNDPLLGKFEGIGVQFNMQEDTIMVLHVIPGGPSEKAGLQDGDRIVKVDGETVAGKNLSTMDVMRLLKGDKGSIVELDIARRGFEDLIPFTIVRDVIPTYSIDISFMPEAGIGYIRLSRFSMTTVKEFSSALDKLMDEGMEKLILDLRGNSGGYLDAAIALADELLEAGKLIVYTEGRARPKRFFYATEKGRFKNQELCILIDEGSASASEIVAGAVQDNDRGMILGRRSFGKGLVQEQLNFPDGSGVRLTVARYYTPTGRSIQRPYENGSREYHADLMARFHGGEMSNPDSIHNVDSLQYVTPEGKIVYGGGGISPDVFVGLEQDERYRYYNQLVQRGLIYRFAFQYTDKERPRLLEFGDHQAFTSRFQIRDALFNDFLEFCRKEGLEVDPEGLDFGRERIKGLMKAYIARNVYGDEGFYPIYLKMDTVYLKALEMIMDPKSEDSSV
jgi:carboxyl-terminal processing protease